MQTRKDRLYLNKRQIENSMKPDVLTLTALVFVIGVLISSIGTIDVFPGEKDAPPPALHQGITIR